MNKHIKIVRLVSVLMTLLITCTMFHGICQLLQAKNSDRKYAEFHDSNLEYDVLFCGSSHMMNDVYPLELYKNYGISSYNIANSAEAMGTTYWVLKTALDECSPDVVVLEVFFQSGTDVTPEQENLLHTWFDGVPLSKNKANAIRSLLPEQMEEYLFDFSLYHSRWSDLRQIDFEKYVLYLHDSDYKCEVTVNTENNIYYNDSDKKMLIDNIINREIIFGRIEDDIRIEVFRANSGEFVDSKVFDFGQDD